jgi:hypothetical protein
LQCIIAITTGQRCRAINHSQDLERIRRSSEAEWRGYLPTLHPKIRACHQQTPAGADRCRLNLGCAGARVVDHIEGALKMQLTRLAMRIAPIIVVNTIR